MLEVRSVTCRYGKVAALRNVSLVVPNGKLTVLVGANGAGKSTMLRTISGLVRPVSGQIIFCGRDIASIYAAERLSAGIAHCPEGRRVFGQMSVFENLEMGAYVRHDSKAIAEDIDHIVSLFPKLGERRHQAAGTLSGGEQQMLAIGRAMMSRPKLLMLDEPSLGLAPNIVERTFEIISDIRQSGTTVLMVEQNAYAALDMCDYAYLLEAGSIVLEGTGPDLVNNPHVREAYLGHGALAV